MAQPGSPRLRQGAVDRRADRLVAIVAIVVALAFLCAALLVALLPSSLRVGTWLPTHLALAGGASTAIVGLVPFFSAAFAMAQPVRAPLRWTALGSVALGALAISAGYAAGRPPLAVIGGLAFIVGLGLTAHATVAPLRRGLGPWSGAVTAGYLAALVMVLVGACLGTLFMTGWQPVLEAWSVVRPAHAWLNLVGFVSLVIATTLLHLFPTVIGARIQRTPSAIITVAGVGGGSAMVAAGFLLRMDVVVRLGALTVLIGAVALAVYAARCWRVRARWSGDAGWHRFTSGGLVSAMAWFELGIAVAAGRLILTGADPTAATANVLLGPLVLGWVGLAVLASATHLVPAIGPGDPDAHARQRVLLGRGATVRLIGADVGIACLAVGLWPAGPGWLPGAGGVLAGLSLAATVGLLACAIATGLRSARAAGQLRA